MFSKIQHSVKVCDAHENRVLASAVYLLSFIGARLRIRSRVFGLAADIVVLAHKFKRKKIVCCKSYFYDVFPCVYFI
jgi:hypothetical protein